MERREMADQYDLFEAVASNVTNKELTRKSDGRKFTLYTVETDHGSFTTAKRDLAQRAYSLIGKPASYHVKTEQRGEFTNYYLESVEPISQAVADSAFTPPMMNQVSGPPSRPDVYQEPVGEPAGPTAKDMMIFRQTAAKVSAQISTTPNEFWLNLDDLVAYFADGTKPSAPDMSGVGMGGSSGFSDDDIPFIPSIDGF